LENENVEAVQSRPMKKPTQYQKWWMGEMLKNRKLYSSPRGASFFTEHRQLLKHIHWGSVQAALKNSWLGWRQITFNSGYWTLTSLGRKALEE